MHDKIKPEDFHFTLKVGRVRDCEKCFQDAVVENAANQAIIESQFSPEMDGLPVCLE